MKGRRRFTSRIVSAVHASKIVGLRAGEGPHRVIGIWAVVARGRVFVRSWSLKPRGWYRTFLETPQGFLYVDDRELRSVPGAGQPGAGVADGAGGSIAIELRVRGVREAHRELLLSLPHAVA